jgi:hypothetical protein
MIPGRFNANKVYFYPRRCMILADLKSAISTSLSGLKQVFFGKFLLSDFRVHLSDLFVKTQAVDPFDDSKNRYVIFQHRFDSKGRRIIPTRTCAFTTLRGAKLEVKNQCVETGLEYLWYHQDKTEFISIKYLRINHDIERARVKHWLKSRHWSDRHPDELDT